VTGPLPRTHFESTSLRSGLRLVSVPRPELHQASLALYVRVGSRFEDATTNGISHFLEHMLFRGTPSKPSAHEQALAFESLGGSLYAATHVDHGVLNVTLPPESLAPALALLGEVVTQPLLQHAEVERGIVREEILEDRDDDGREIDPDNLSRSLLYGDHPLGFTITGDPESLDRFDEPLLRAHLARHYVADNALLVVAGNVPAFADVEGIAERAFEGLARGARTSAPAAPAPVPGKKRKSGARLRVVDNQSSQTELRLAFRAVGEDDALEPATEMLLRVLDDGMSTRLYARICDELGLCYDVSGMFEVYDDDGVFDFAAGVVHERTPRVCAEILAIAKDLADHGPTAEELDRAKRRHAWSTRALRDDAEELGAWFGLNGLSRAVLTPEDRHAVLEAVTREQVRAAAERTFRPERMGVVAVGLLDGKARRELERLL